MLAEKFFLILETLLSHASDDRPHIVISTAPHTPIIPPRAKKRTTLEGSGTQVISAG
jgi:hypothetical protein